MGDHSHDVALNKALSARDAFKSDRKAIDQISEYIKKASPKQKERLNHWQLFFSKYQMPEKVLAIKAEIDSLESTIQKARANQKEGYIDPSSKKFVAASNTKMRLMQVNNPDEKVRKACFDALEQLAPKYVEEFIRLVNLKNRLAQELGYTDFYAYKLENEEGMQTEDLFAIFETIYAKTKFAFKNIRAAEKKIPGLRKPWNFFFIMSGDFTQEEEPYFQFEEALMRWGRSFSALGIDYQQGILQLDLLERKGKYNNGFCHWPDIRYMHDGAPMPGSSNFTCNVSLGQVMAGNDGMHTLFHEGGHAAHLLNVTMSDACVATEYPPQSTAWAETQSMFLDTLYSSIEWKVRYARNSEGQSYPFDLFKRKVEKLHLIAPIGLNSIISVCDFERQIYSTKKLTSEKVITIAKQTYKKYYDRSVDSLRLLDIPHIYEWESSCSYHGYALATLALSQWRKYFYKKYGYIVDNRHVGKEMKKVWMLGSTKSFPEFVKIATGKKLSPYAYLESATAPSDKKISRAKKIIERQSKVKDYTGPVSINATIKMVHGKETIADNRKSFEDMASKYKMWLTKQK